MTRLGKRTNQGAFDDGVNSAMRYFINNYQDENRQRGIDILLGFATTDGIKSTVRTFFLGHMFIYFIYFIYLFLSLFIYLSIYLFIYFYLFIYLFIYFYLFIYLFIYLWVLHKFFLKF